MNIIRSNVLIFSAYLIAAVFSSAIAWGEVRPSDFGRQWVRTHPYTLMGLTQFPEIDIKLYKQAGLNTVLAWRGVDAKGDILRQTVDAAAMPWLGHTTARQGLDKDFQKLFFDYMEQYPNCVGWLFNDEPNLERMPPAAELMNWTRRQYPKLLILSNALPIGGRPSTYLGSKYRENYSYRQYVNDYIRILRPDIMMFDIYPFPKTGSVSNQYFTNLQIVRKASLKAGIPYWIFVQSYIAKNRRMPSDSDNRLQLFSPLTFGYTGITYFTYDGSFTDGLLRKGGEKTPMFDYAAKANREVSNIAGPMRFLTSTQVRFIKATHGSPVPQGLQAWDKHTDRNSLFKEITVSLPANVLTPPKDQATYLADAPYRGGLIGYFRDDRREKYFMITNTWHSLDATAEQRQLTFHIRFDPTVKAVQRLNRMTGKPETLTIDPKNGLVITLPGGTGDLFKFGDGPFIGLHK